MTNEYVRELAAMITEAEVVTGHIRGWCRMQTTFNVSAEDVVHLARRRTLLDSHVRKLIDIVRALQDQQAMANETFDQHIDAVIRDVEMLL